MANKTPYYIGFGCFIVSFVCCGIAFGTGSWFEAEGEDRLFRRLGLWEACFDGYEHTSDYIGKAYHGCWWIFHKEYSYIRDWIIPSWFIAVQTLMTFAIVLQFIGLGVFPGAGREDPDSTSRETMASIISGLTFCCITVSVVVFGSMIGEDRTWMPRPDSDKPGWSFGCAVVAGFFAAFSCISITVYTLVRKWELKQDYREYGHKGSMVHMVPKV
jgi:hypothetical protein